MTREESKKLYEGKHFYEIVKPKSGGIQLFGPFENIHYVAKLPSLPSKFSADTHKMKEYKFVQVIDGKPVQFFTEEEILVTDRKL